MICSHVGNTINDWGSTDGATEALENLGSDSGSSVSRKASDGSIYFGVEILVR